ncbi:hypothetical protein sometimes fused to ribosomal protein S6 glutaminyl transferase [Nonlabens marinus S1-08]|uniref:Retropepsin-like aspartic endopeptidase domain-containing protein n=1 Tax=Nonlabens marinus S1-08 TaxID=1454201 RepID=W8VNI7_9FLAO|nr:hypothetical protein sometimes fused to ribosomal protein S6 glutaminyl transferase [Nonlabens marinus S1-08]
MIKSKKTIIGRTDKADFPKLNLDEIDIKIDTGAYTSSIHCQDIVEKDGVLHAVFLDKSHPQFHGQHIEFTDYEETTVRSSNGLKEQRFEVKSNIRLFNKLYKISLTLNDRSEMRFPVLLGRKFLSKKFIVDPELQDISYLQSQYED